MSHSPSSAATSPAIERTVSPLVAVLRRELELVTEFIRLLRAEAVCLQGNKTDGLDALVAEKTVVLAQLEAAEKERLAFVPTPSQAAAADAAEVSKDIHAPMRELLVRQQDDEASRLWQELRALSAQVRELNQKNGEKLSAHLLRTGEALSILMQGQDKTTLYGSDGQTRTSGSGRTFGSA